MRFAKYIEHSSGDEDVKKFRSLNIGIVKEDEHYKDIVERITEKYELPESALKIVDKANRYLDSMYCGGYKFGFCIDEATDLQSAKIKRIEKLKLLMFGFNDELSKLKRTFERNLGE